MPDIKTALATALKEWEPPTEGTVIEPAAPAPAQKQPRPNMTRDTFAMIRDNPGISRADAVQRLETMGHKPTSTTSIISQMVKAKMVDETGYGILSTKRKNYTPLQTKVRKVTKAQAKVVAKVVDTPKPREAAPQPQATHALIAPEPQASAIKAAQIVLEDSQRVSAEIDAWLNNVTLRYASLVYERLHAIFGAQK